MVADDDKKATKKVDGERAERQKAMGSYAKRIMKVSVWIWKLPVVWTLPQIRNSMLEDSLRRCYDY